MITRPPIANKSQRGYALLLVMCLVAVLAASAMAVVPSVLTEGRRQNEQEMIWRGEQYKRGIKLYNRKLGKFPTTLDDLTKPKTGSIRFMRSAYKDPMNKTDGSWRLIYVGPAGQLVGSLKPPENPLVPGAPGFGTAASSVAGASSGGFSSSSSFGANSNAQSASSSFSSFSSQPFGSASPGATGQPGDPASDPYLNPPAGAGADESELIGGNIIGVGSKVNRHSIIVYEKAKNYLLFEFVWNPAKDAAAAIQQLNGPGPGINGVGAPPSGSQQTPIGVPMNNGPSGGTPAPPPTQPQPQ